MRFLTWVAPTLAVLCVGSAHAAEVEAVTIFYIGSAAAPAALGGMSILPGQTVTDVPLRTISSSQAPDLRCSETYTDEGAIAVSCKAEHPAVACETKVAISVDGAGQANSPACGPTGERLAVKVQRVALPPTEPRK